MEPKKTKSATIRQKLFIKSHAISSPENPSRALAYVLIKEYHSKINEKAISVNIDYVIPASFQLKKFAKSKGVVFNENISMEELRDLIDGN